MAQGRWVLAGIGIAELIGLVVAGLGWLFDSRAAIGFGLTLALVILVAFWPIKLLLDLEKIRRPR